MRRSGETLLQGVENSAWLRGLWDGNRLISEQFSMFETDDSIHPLDGGVHPGDGRMYPSDMCSHPRHGSKHLMDVCIYPKDA